MDNANVTYNIDDDILEYIVSIAQQISQPTQEWSRAAAPMKLFTSSRRGIVILKHEQGA